MELELNISIWDRYTIASTLHSVPPRSPTRSRYPTTRQYVCRKSFRQLQLEGYHWHRILTFSQVFWNHIYIFIGTIYNQLFQQAFPGLQLYAQRSGNVWKFGGEFWNQRGAWASSKLIPVGRLLLRRHSNNRWRPIGVTYPRSMMGGATLTSSKGV